MSDRTIAEVKSAKHELEKSIARLLEEFVDETGVKIEDIDLSRQETMAGEIVRYHVTVEATL